MDTSVTRLSCPHCNDKLQAFDLPDDSNWDGGYQYACFNDECPYYQRGWAWMKEKYNVISSYRYRIEPQAGAASPLAVDSPTAFKDRIVEIDESEDGRKDENA